RSESERQAALAALADGTIDVLASGHDPRGPEEKRLPFADSEPGMSGAETLFALGMTLVHNRTIDLDRLFDLLARIRAKILGIEACAFEPGVAADIIMLAPNAPWQVSGTNMLARAGSTPFDGMPVLGKVIRVWKGGSEIA